MIQETDQAKPEGCRKNTDLKPATSKAKQQEQKAVGAANPAKVQTLKPAPPLPGTPKKAPSPPSGPNKANAPHPFHPLPPCEKPKKQLRKPPCVLQPSGKDDVSKDRVEYVANLHDHFVKQMKEIEAAKQGKQPSAAAEAKPDAKTKKEAKPAEAAKQPKSEATQTKPAKVV